MAMRRSSSGRDGKSFSSFPLPAAGMRAREACGSGWSSSRISNSGFTCRTYHENGRHFLSNPDGIQGHNFTTQVAHADDRRTLQGRLTFVRYSNESEFFIADASVFLSVAADVLDKLGTHITREDVEPEVVSRLADAVKLIERRTAPRGEE